MLAKFLMVALGGSLGAMARYAISLALAPKTPAEGSFGFPYATLLANVVGSLLIGLAYVFIVEKALVSGYYRELVIVGFLGALTTFSSFSIEVLTMIQNNQSSIALVYIVSSLIFCIVAAFLGVAIGRLL